MSQLGLIFHHTFPSVRGTKMIGFALDQIFPTFVMYNITIPRKSDVRSFPKPTYSCLTSH